MNNTFTKKQTEKGFEFSRSVDENTCNYLERLAYELEGAKRIIKELILDNPDNPEILNSESYKHYEKRYEETTASYEIAKRDLELQYIGNDNKNDVGFVMWNLDYATCVLTVKMSGNKYKDMTAEEFFNVRTKN